MNVEIKPTTDDVKENVDFRVGKKRLKGHIIIGAIGDKGVGKTTLLCMLAEILFDMGYHSTVGVDFKNAHKLTLKEPSFILVDNIESPKEVNRLRNCGALIVRVRYGLKSNLVENQEVSIWNECPSDFFIYSRDNFRLFNFELKDLFQAEMLNHKLIKDKLII
jgi:GTPase SAR1 family protein